MKRVKLSDKQFEGLEESTRRELIKQLMIIDTPQYVYALGAKGRWWTLVRYDMQESIGGRNFPKDYKPEIIDEWL